MMEAIIFVCNISVVTAFLFGIGIVWRWRKMKMKRYKCLILIIYSILLLFLLPFIRLAMDFAGFQDRFIRGKYSKHRPTEFFKIEENLKTKTIEMIEYLDIKKGVYRDHITKCETFVISNPPNDTSLIKRIVEEYNFQTIPLDTLKKYNRYTREFYRETECLTRNYEEGKRYPAPPWWSGCDCPIRECVIISNPKQELRNHNKEHLMSTEYSYYPFYGGRWEYTYTFGFISFRDTIDKGFTIKDIDSFYEEKDKTTKVPSAVE